MEDTFRESLCVARLRYGGEPSVVSAETTLLRGAAAPEWSPLEDGLTSVSPCLAFFFFFLLLHETQLNMLAADDESSLTLSPSYSELVRHPSSCSSGSEESNIKSS